MTSICIIPKFITSLHFQVYLLHKPNVCVCLKESKFIILVKYQYELQFSLKMLIPVSVILCSIYEKWLTMYKVISMQFRWEKDTMFNFQKQF